MDQTLAALFNCVELGWHSAPAHFCAFELFN